jgi:predicted DNA-binding transcriptional regulator AlpA
LDRDELLTVPEVIRELKISRATFYRWHETGKGPKAVKLPGGTIRGRRSALDRFLTDCSALA